MKLQKPLIVILTSVAMTSAFAQKTVQLYHPGEDTHDQGISLRGWGSGTISQTDETFFVGSYSLRISTRSFFQGGIVNLEQPIDLSSEFTNKDDLLRFAFKVSDGSVVNGVRPEGLEAAEDFPEHPAVVRAAAVRASQAGQVAAARASRAGPAAVVKASQAGPAAVEEGPAVRPDRVRHRFSRTCV
jgi:hypothetical protein